MTPQTNKIDATKIDTDKKFGALITRLINKENLTRKEASQAFITVLNNETNEMQQGAFLAALAAKGETAMGPGPSPRCAAPWTWPKPWGLMWNVPQTWLPKALKHPGLVYSTA